MPTIMAKPKIYHNFWANTIFRCPHCGVLFEHKDMWVEIVKHHTTVSEIMDVLNCGWSTVVNNLRKYKLVNFVKGTREYNDWNKLAQKLGFRNARDMFYTLKVTLHYTFTSICKQIDYDEKDIDTLKIACRDFLDPGRKLEGPLLKKGNQIVRIRRK